MDSTLHSANIAVDESKASLVTQHDEAEVVEEEEHHIHLPNPSLWPALLSVAILVTVAGLLFIPDSPWLSIVGAPFVLIGILGWALEDPMAAPKEQYISSSAATGVQSRYRIGQDILDSNNEWIGTVQARFSHYILADPGGVSTRVYYVPVRLIVEDSEDSGIHLTVSENDLFNRRMDRVPSDLYEESAELGIPKTSGVPMFGNGPLSPAETGHYNYGPNFPGINTDAAGSYHPEEVRPAPQKYVGERRKVYTNRKVAPARQ